MHLASNISHLARIKGISNSALSKELDVSASQVGYYMNGKSNPKLEALVKMAKLFNVAIDDLILEDLTKNTGRPYGEGVADKTDNEDEQLRELNKLLRQRVDQVEKALKESDPDLAAELGIE
jgi:transcriptional regulator with XRE-family HTH domain